MNESTKNTEDNLDARIYKLEDWIKQTEDRLEVLKNQQESQDKDIEFLLKSVDALLDRFQ